MKSSTHRILYYTVLGLLAFHLRLVGQSAPVFTILHSFNSNGTEGYGPEGALVQGSDGNFYGTTYGGGDGSFFGDGTVFKVTAAGAQTSLYSFSSEGTDGAFPSAALVQGGDGNFYGTTTGGGDAGYVGSNSFGTVFKITAAGALTTLHRFDGTDGGIPYAALVQGSDGNFYGTTARGGSDDDSGTVFMITPAGVLTTLHSFTGAGTDGGIPYAALVQGSDGNFYGTTTQDGGNGDGTVFKITAAGMFTTLHTFTGTDGSRPFAPLVLGSDGNFYGTTGDINSNNDGTVFKITAAGVLTTLHTFTGTDGSFPRGALVEGSDGNFYGTTARGGSDDDSGTVFMITPAGVLTTLHSFTGAGTDGANPDAALVHGSDGNFYGTTFAGGNYRDGTVFKLSFPATTPLITSATGATATTGQAFSYQILATGNPTSYATSSIPPGLSFSTSKGRFTGTPTRAGTYKPLLSAINSTGKSSVNLNLVVKLGAPVITSSTSASAAVGKTFTYQITATNSPTSYTTSSIPPGLSFSTSTGKFTGTPTKAGTYKPLLSAINGAGKGSVNLNLVVKEAAPVITSALTESAQVGVAFSYQVTATNSPTSYKISSMPPGLMFSTTTGKLSGTPTKAGSYRPLVSATNSGGTGSANVALTVKPAKPVITSDLNPPARQGVAFAYQIVATNSPTSYATSSIPPGLSFSTSTGKFTGTPTKAGTYKPLVSAMNSGGTASVNLNLVVKAPAN